MEKKLDKKFKKKKKTLRISSFLTCFGTEKILEHVTEDCI